MKRCTGVPVVGLMVAALLSVACQDDTGGLTSPELPPVGFNVAPGVGFPMLGQFEICKHFEAASPQDFAQFDVYYDVGAPPMPDANGHAIAGPLYDDDCEVIGHSDTNLEVTVTEFSPPGFELDHMLVTTLTVELDGSVSSHDEELRGTPGVSRVINSEVGVFVEFFNVPAGLPNVSADLPCTTAAVTKKSEIRSREIKWKIRNTGEEEIILTSLELTGIPYPVKKIKRGKRELFKGLAASGSIITDWKGKEENRKIKPGKEIELKMQFEVPKGFKIPVDGDLYDVLAVFDSGCPLPFEVYIGSFDKCSKPIDVVSMAWNGAEAVDITAWKGPVGSTLLSTASSILPGDRLDVGGYAGSPNDVIWEVFQAGGAKIGESTFHLSCSDPDMNDVTDCGTPQGDGKGNVGGFLNDWLLEGLTAAGGSFDCSIP